MFKRPAAVPKTSRKKRKGNATYSTITYDRAGGDETSIENVRMWGVSASKKTGRVLASRRMLQHHRKVSPTPPEVPSTSKNPGAVEETADEAGFFADSESPSKTVDKRRLKRKRARVRKENDSVSELPISPAPWTYSRSRQRWNIGSSTIIQSF